MTRRHLLYAVGAGSLFLAGCSEPMATAPTGASALVTTAQTAQTGGVAHSVTGSGDVSDSGISFRSSVSAHSDANGNTWGEVSVPLNLTSEGAGRVTFSGKVTCLAVEGRSAWIGFDIAHSSNGDVVPTGLSAIVLVRDLGGPGEDVSDGEFFPADVRCTDKPTGFSETVVLNGNYTVR